MTPALINRENIAVDQLSLYSRSLLAASRTGIVNKSELVTFIKKAKNISFLGAECFTRLIGSIESFFDMKLNPVR